MKDKKMEVRFLREKKHRAFPETSEPCGGSKNREPDFK